ncbi:hypothetical protein ACSBR2_016434 [Camellia fascicularis]
MGYCFQELYWCLVMLQIGVMMSILTLYFASFLRKLFIITLFLCSLGDSLNHVMMVSFVSVKHFSGSSFFRFSSSSTPQPKSVFYVSFIIRSGSFNFGGTLSPFSLL